MWARSVENEAVRGDPANGLEHMHGPRDQVRCGRWRRQRRQRQAERGGLLAETANPELAALIGHSALLCGHSGRRQSQALEEMGDQKQRDYGATESQPGKSEFR
jgi:hypothetical protein